MKKQFNIYIALLFLMAINTLNAQTIRVKFEVAQLSVNIAEGTTELMPFFIVLPDTFKLDVYRH